MFEKVSRSLKLVLGKQTYIHTRAKSLYKKRKKDVALPTWMNSNEPAIV